LSSAASAGNAAIDHMRDWVKGSDEWQSIAIYTDGKTYNVPQGLIFSFPCTTTNGKIKVVEGLKLDDEQSM
jgi:malate dehydrogenase